MHSAENSVVQILKSIQQEICTNFGNTNLRNIVQSNENNSKKIKELETEDGDLIQYIRKNNNKISGIPDICKMMFLKIKL